MSTTTPRTLKAGADVRLRGVYESYVRALGDLDKAGDVEDAAYYQGEVDAYLDVLDTFGELEPEASSDAETENDTYCEIVFDGTDTNGDIWNRCTVHNRLVFDGAPVCEGYRAPAYVEPAEVRKTRIDIETGGNYA